MNGANFCLEVLIQLRNLENTNVPHTKGRPELEGFGSLDKINWEESALKVFGNIKDCSVTRMKQNTARDWLANFVIRLVVNRAPCQLLDNFAAPSWGNMKCAKKPITFENQENYAAVIWV